MLLSLNPSFFLCWQSMFSGPERAAGWSTSRSKLPCTGQMLSKYRVCLKAGATVCLLLCFSAHRANTTPLTLLYGILTMLLFWKNGGAFILHLHISVSFSLLFSSLHLSDFLSLCSPFLPVSGLGGSVTFYPWATRAQPLTLAWSLTSTTKPRPQVKVCISNFLCNELWDLVCLLCCVFLVLQP